MPRFAIPAALVIVLAGTASAHAVSPNQPDSAHLLRAIERLSVLGRVLYVAAHPDDENTRLLAWLEDNQRVHAGYLSLTRGEGGQNLIGSEQAPLLGVIRTQELLAARGIDGAEQLFGLERDFGYSKTAEETLNIWGKDDALGDLVWAIRRFEPDVIITRFSPEDNETHGHHTASAILAVQAFHAAADPKAYPDQLRWVKPWQADRVIWNKGIFGPAKAGATDGFLAVDVGGFDPVLGQSPGEVAARSRSMHKSQGFGASPQRGPAMEYFKLLAGEPMTSSILDGVDLTWGRVADSKKLRAILSHVRAKFDVEHPAASVPALLEALEALESLPDSIWKTEKTAELAAVIAACSGVYVDATALEPTAVPGGEVKLTLTALNRSRVGWKLHSVKLLGAETVLDKPMEENHVVTSERSAMLPHGTLSSNPYWLEEEPGPGRWKVRDINFVGMPEQPPVLEAELVFSVGTRRISLKRPVTYVWNDPVAGERRRPLEVLPPATLNPAESNLMFPDATPRNLTIVVRASRNSVAGTVTPQPPQGFQIEPSSLPFKLGEAGTEQTLTFRVKPPDLAPGESSTATGILKLQGSLQGGGSLDRSLVRIDYPHIPTQTLTPLAQVKLVRFNMRRAFKRVGYIPGAGDEVPAALRQVGYDVTTLSDAALANEALDSFDAIVVGVRAFNTNESLPRFHQRLMDYVSGGGTLIAQYNTQNRISRITGQIGPWPFNISQDRVTDERASVDALDPQNPILHVPNWITDADFKDWVQERGLYFADTWDEHYKPVFSLHDPGESAKKGALLIGAYGKGRFVYTGLAFFRQLPAGVPGAYRLFANLLAHEQ
jgi:LmbE family N-acetylglucosaminyl deacetylase